MTPGEPPATPLRKSVQQAISYQSYERASPIDGVWIRPLRKLRAENGWFAELFRLTGGEDDASPAGSTGFQLRQLSASFATPHRINAFHIHPLRVQNEVWTVLQGQLLVWLIDCRADSATEGLRQRVILSAEEPAQLFIPAGVAHGYRAGMDGALLVYAMDDQFDPERPNEGRLAWDHFGEDLWTEDRG